MKKRSCAVIGSTPNELAAGIYDDDIYEPLVYHLRQEILKLSDSGVEDFYSDISRGVSMWCGEIVLSVGLNLIPVIPQKEQHAGWSDEHRHQYRHILDCCYKCVLIDDADKRVRYMLGNADTILMTRNSTGAGRPSTHKTIYYNTEAGRKLVCVNRKALPINESPIQCDATELDEKTLKWLKNYGWLKKVKYTYL